MKYSVIHRGNTVAQFETLTEAEDFIWDTYEDVEFIDTSTVEILYRHPDGTEICIVWDN